MTPEQGSTIEMADDPRRTPLASAGSAIARTWQRQALRVVFLALVGGVFFVFQGLSLHLSSWSQAFVNAIVKYAYPDEGQRDTTVLLFREDNIRDLGTHYPVPHAFHAQVLEALASYRPRAVFIDFAFIDARDTEDTAALAAALCALQSSRPEGTAVFLAAPAASTGETAVLPALRQCATLVSPAIAENQGVSGILTYATGEQRPGGFMPSASFATARALSGVDPAKAQRMEIIWGNGVAPLNRKWMGCVEPGLLEAARKLLVHDPLALKKNCPYSRTVSVGHVMQSSGDADVEAALTGQTVFYGGAFEFTGDRIASPVYAELPGVYLHAMAHDNLVTFGSRYKRAERGANVLDVVVLLVTAALLVLLPRGEPWPPRAARWIARRPAWLRQPLAFFGKAPRKAETRDAYLRHLATVAAGAAMLLGLLALAFQVGGLEAALWLALAAYFAYRIGGTRDVGFALFLVLMVLTGLFAYSWLDLGPRNVLAYFAFFEGVRFLQHRLAEAHKVWRGLRPTNPPSRFHDSIDSVLSWYGTDAAPLTTPPATPAEPVEKGKVP